MALWSLVKERKSQIMFTTNLHIKSLSEASYSMTQAHISMVSCIYYQAKDNRSTIEDAFNRILADEMYDLDCLEANTEGSSQVIKTWYSNDLAVAKANIKALQDLRDTMHLHFKANDCFVVTDDKF